MKWKSALDDPEWLCRVGEGLGRSSGLSGRLRLTPLQGGANNRVFCLEGGNGRAFLKAYFRHPDDHRDRLGAEFGFSAFAWGQGIRALPRPLAQDREAGVGLYEFVEGRRPVPGEVSDGWVEQAIDFFRAVNRARHAAEAHALPLASEACLSLGVHLALVEARVRRLGTIPETSPIDREASRFVREELAETWSRLEARFRHEVAQAKYCLEGELDPAARCLSPSDFGYHNAIVEASGRLRFIDFEYAGWDDPAKTVCDFFCQPAMPAPVTWLDRFAVAVFANYSERERHRRRAAILLPLYRLKWCCIMLNDFLPAGRARRRFAGGEAGLQERAEAQLAKARRSLAAIREELR